MMSELAECDQLDEKALVGLFAHGAEPAIAARLGLRDRRVRANAVEARGR